MSRGVRPSPWQAPYHGLHRVTQRRWRFTGISSRKTKWPNQRRFSKMEAQNRRIHHGANSRKTRCVGSPTTHQHRGLATTGFPSNQRRSLGLSPLPLASPPRPRVLRSFPRISPAASRPSDFPSRSALLPRDSRLPPFPTPRTHTIRNLWIPVPHRPSPWL